MSHATPPSSQKIPKGAEAEPAIMPGEEAVDDAGRLGAEGEGAQPPGDSDEATSGDQEKRRSGGTLGRLKMPKAPKVAGKRVTLEKNRDTEAALDVVSRDPKSLNTHCKVQFEDIIAEPDPTVFSFDSVWTVSYKVFTSTKLWCYRITSLICAVPAAICWGIEFAMLSFCTIWCWQPSLKAFDISLWYTRRIYEILLKVFVEPCFHAAGKCLSHVVVTVRREV